MKVLVTGSSSMMDLYKDHPEHTLIETKSIWDLSNPRKVEILLRAYEPDMVIHAANQPGSEEDVIYENTVMTAALIHYSVLVGVRKFICFDETMDFHKHLEASKMDYEILSFDKFGVEILSEPSQIIFIMF